MFDLAASMFTAPEWHNAAPERSRQTCPICLDRTAKEAFGRCGHEFCFRCLEEWQAEHDSCPLCRASVSGHPPPVDPQSATTVPPPPRPQQSWRDRPSPAADGRAHYRLSSDRERMEREHAERSMRRVNRLALERRLDRYRAGVFTPSGRPYDELPVVSLEELRKTFVENKRSVLGPISNQ